MLKLKGARRPRTDDQPEKDQITNTKYSPLAQHHRWRFRDDDVDCWTLPPLPFAWLLEKGPAAGGKRSAMASTATTRTLYNFTSLYQVSVRPFIYLNVRPYVFLSLLSLDPLLCHLNLCISDFILQFIFLILCIFLSFLLYICFKIFYSIFSIFLSFHF